MRAGVTLKVGGASQTQQHPPYQHQYYVSSPPPSSASASASAVGWKSPVPYLFGGLAAMLGLIAFALLILACSYWKLSGYLDSGDGKPKEAANATTGKFENSILVIMAGDDKPTYVATPAASASSRAPSFGDNDSKSSGSSSSSNSGEENRRENVNEAMTATVRIGRNGGEEEEEEEKR